MVAENEKGLGGRPLLYPDAQQCAMDNYSVKLTASHARFARKISESGKNLSEGLRIALDYYKQMANKATEGVKIE